MALLMEGELSYSWEAGFVHVEDEAGQRVCIRLAEFYRALDGAKRFEGVLAATVHREQRGRVVSLQPGCQLIRGEPV